MRGHLRTSGFTLIELLVVVALIGLAVTLAVIHIDRDTDRLAAIEARRFKSLVEYARDESLMTGKPYAIEFDQAGRGYQFLTFGTLWQVVERDSVLKPRRLPEGLRMDVDLLQTGGTRALVVVDGLGAITPFVLHLRGDKKEYSVTLDAAQNLQVQHIDVADRSKG